MPDFETLLYEEVDGVAWVTLNRPDVHNAFNVQMQHELKECWRFLRTHDAVRCIVLTGAGEKAFCTGIDRAETMGSGDRGSGDGGSGDGGSGDGGSGDGARQSVVGSVGTPFMFDDPGDNIGPKSNDLWKPVIAAVNGMACGGAFYMLGEVEFIIAAEHATFFDPHVTYGMTAAFEPLHMLAKMPFPEIMRLSLLGNHERVTAQRAHQIGLVSEVVPAAELRGATAWAANAIASAPPLAIQGTVRALWSGLEHTRNEALRQAYLYIGLGTDRESIRQGQEQFASGKRIEWRTR